MTMVQRASQTQPCVVEPNPRPSFTGFPETTILESGKVPIAETAERWDCAAGVWSLGERRIS